MDPRLLFLAVVVGFISAEDSDNVRIPLVKLQTNYGVHQVSENECATKADVAELKRQLSVNISVMMEQLKSKPIDCGDIQSKDYRATGIYTIYPFQRARGISVRCDMDTSTGGWTVIQRRVFDSNFYRTWDEYETGFGDLSTNFWLGNHYIHLITSQDRYELRVDLASTDGATAYAQYREFSVGDAESGYKLFVGGYSGNAGDSLIRDGRGNGMKFSTYDRDNDFHSDNCAVKYHGAWWYKECLHSNLNGDYGTESAKGPVWSSWKGYDVPMKMTEMKIRRIV
ncbi:fibrinogen C domain-containing protein 1-B-like [Mercenaria mercenaria]|uniref:fibrinogen C domain-containing protein 1-B-like n=1 Tax=Mercenaria mercenaria TaxID=6596 RepID=UPI001E1D59D9|nr:fibrinogen C domain-containing protein 1-B-like [Mercenaria mercenaria]